MKLVSFNANGIRARMHQLQILVENHDPWLIGIQETKVDDPQFPQADIEALGYHVERFGQKGHYGVALLSKKPPEWVEKGFAYEDETAQKRMIMAHYQTDANAAVTVINGYFPQGEGRSHPEKFPNKARFYADLTQLLQDRFTPDDPVVVMGDMNIAPEDSDVGIGPDNMKRWLRTGKCCFLPEEREWLQTLLSWGLIDTFRHQNPEVDDCFSWFDYRSGGFTREPKRGIRIDLILATKPLIKQLAAVGIDYDMRGMEKPSDHCPVWCELTI